MAQEPPAQDLMNYEGMAQDALRGVVKAALLRAGAPGGLPGAHHFYLTFKTGAPGVEGPEELLSRYPDEMTIVLQHQFWDLEVGDRDFGVTLKFGGRPQSLVVPYAAMTRFYDPSVQFLLQFDAEAGPGPQAAPAPAPEAASRRTPEGEPCGSCVRPAVGPGFVDVGQDGDKGFEIAVDVGDGGKEHGPILAVLAASHKVAAHVPV